MSKSKYIIYLLTIILIFLLDRVTKIYLIDFFNDINEAYITLTSFLNIILVWNSGIGFGLLQFDNKITYNLITLLIIIINVLLIYFLIKAENFQKILFSMILGGSLGNLYDRIYYSAVPDFIDLNYGGYHWFVFNIADIFISVGIFGFIFSEFFKKKNEK